MWDDYSFATASQRSISYDPVDDHISPSSTRGSSRFSGDMSRRSFNASRSIAQLTQQLDHHTLEPQQRPSLLRSPPSEPHSLYSTIRRDSPSSPHTHHAKRRQRESMVRRQCSAANMSRLTSLVQDLLEDESWAADNLVPSLEEGDGLSPLQPCEISPLDSPTSSCMSPSSCSEEDGDIESASSQRSQQKFKVGKELAHSSSREFMKRQYRDIRMRKSTARRSLPLHNRRD